MDCPFCHAEKTEVTDSRFVRMNEGSQVRRRRKCTECGGRFTTYEKAALVLPLVIKREGQREAFSEDKLRRGLQRALEKRYVTAKEIEGIISQIKLRLRSWEEREIDSKAIGEWVMDALHALDEVAYVRFASVYRRFQDISEFKEEIARMQEKAT